MYMRCMQWPPISASMIIGPSVPSSSSRGGKKIYVLGEKLYVIFCLATLSQGWTIKMANALSFSEVSPFFSALGCAYTHPCERVGTKISRGFEKAMPSYTYVWNFKDKTFCTGASSYVRVECVGTGLYLWAVYVFYMVFWLVVGGVECGAFVGESDIGMVEFRDYWRMFSSGGWGELRGFEEGRFGGGGLMVCYRVVLLGWMDVECGDLSPANLYERGTQENGEQMVECENLSRSQPPQTRSSKLIPYVKNTLLNSCAIAEYEGFFLHFVDNSKAMPEQDIETSGSSFLEIRRRSFKLFLPSCFPSNGGQDLSGWFAIMRLPKLLRKDGLREVVQDFSAAAAYKLFKQEIHKKLTRMAGFVEFDYELYSGAEAEAEAGCLLIRRRPSNKKAIEVISTDCLSQYTFISFLNSVLRLILKTASLPS
ncbi:hypothetical protein Tco_0111000 [Tanacetum coccineum]